MQQQGNSAREGAARQRSRERRGRLLLGRRGRGLLRRRSIRRRRGGATADDLLRFWRRRRSRSAALLVRRGVGIGGLGRRCRGLLALALRLRGALRLRLRRWRGGSRRGLRVLLVDLLLAGALVEILRHALLEARHAFGEDRLALARKLFLGVEEIEQIGRIETAHAATAAAGQRAGQRDDDGKGDQAFRSAHGQCLVQLAVSSLRPAAAMPAAPRRASASLAATRRHWQSGPATAAPPSYHWRARPTGPAVRARYGEKSRPRRSRVQAAAACSDTWWFPGATARHGSAPDRVPARRRWYRQRCRRTFWPPRACRGWRLPRPCAAGPACGTPMEPWRRGRQRPLPPPHACLLPTVRRPCRRR